MTQTQPPPAPILALLAEETALGASQVENTVALLDEGATVPFIARYRKERTGELDEVQILDRATFRALSRQKFQRALATL